MDCEFTISLFQIKKAKQKRQIKRISGLVYLKLQKPQRRYRNPSEALFDLGKPCPLDGVRVVWLCLKNGFEIAVAKP